MGTKKISFKNRGLLKYIGFFFILPIFILQSAHSADDKVDLKKTKEDESPTRVQVVQNRAFSKAKRVKIGLFGGVIFTDPFLNVNNAGGKIAYNFNDDFAFQAVGWKDIVSASSSLKKFEQTNGFTVNTNEPRNFYAGEFLWSPVYGKLSFMNRSILYYDLHIGLGAGLRKTETGTNFTYLLNIGQDLFITKNITVEFEYRMLKFKQDIKEKVIAANMGKVIGVVNETSQIFTLGIGFLF